MDSTAVRTAYQCKADLRNMETVKIQDFCEDSDPICILSNSSSVSI